MDVFFAGYAHAQQAITDFLHGVGGLILYFSLLVILRLASLFVKAWGYPYAYTSYLGNGGKSPSKCKNSQAGTRPAPRLLILKS